MDSFFIDKIKRKAKIEVSINKRGISMAVLVLTVTVILILSGTVFMSFNGISTSIKQREFANEIHNLQNIIEQYKFLNGKYPTTESVDFDITEIFDEYGSQFSSEPGYSQKKITLEKIDLYETGVESISRGIENSENDVYAVSTATGNLYYLEGVEIGNTTYYTLTDELKEKLEI